MFVRKFRRARHYVNVRSRGGKFLQIRGSLMFRSRINSKFPKPFHQGHFKMSVDAVKTFVSPYFIHFQQQYNIYNILYNRKIFERAYLQIYCIICEILK
jgi:hypothetical protein